MAFDERRKTSTITTKRSLRHNEQMRSSRNVEREPKISTFRTTNYGDNDHRFDNHNYKNNNNKRRWRLKFDKNTLLSLWCVTLCFFFFMNISAAATIRWKQPKSGLWHDAKNWLPPRVPNMDDDVFITVEGPPYEVALEAFPSVTSASTFSSFAMMAKSPKNQSISNGSSRLVTIRSLTLGGAQSSRQKIDDFELPYGWKDPELAQRTHQLRVSSFTVLNVRTFIRMERKGLLNLRPLWSEGAVAELEEAVEAATSAGRGVKQGGGKPTITNHPGLVASERPKVLFGSRFVNSGGAVVGNGDIEGPSFLNGGLVSSSWWLEPWGAEPDIGELNIESNYAQYPFGLASIDVVVDEQHRKQHGQINIIGQDIVLNGSLKVNVWGPYGLEGLMPDWIQVLTFTSKAAISDSFNLKVLEQGDTQAPSILCDRCESYRQEQCYSADCYKDYYQLNAYSCDPLCSSTEAPVEEGDEGAGFAYDDVVVGPEGEGLRVEHCTQTFGIGILIGVEQEGGCDECPSGYYRVDGVCTAWCDVNNCYSHGFCVTDVEGVVPYCLCDEGWKGTSCNIQDCPGTPDCLGRGKCVGNDGPPQCVCDEGWSGADCGRWTGYGDPPVASGDCPLGVGDLQCSGRGHCDTSTQPHTCVCDPGWEGTIDCSGKCKNNCFSRGTCVTSTSSAPICDCNVGWQGSDCSKLIGDDGSNSETTDLLVIIGSTVGGTVVLLTVVIIVVGTLVSGKVRGWKSARQRDKRKNEINF
ncbi:Tenascin C [Balamuthia mandrillaris]